MIFASRVVLFVIRLALYYVYGLLRFFSKPGSRILVPLALIVAALLTRPALHIVITYQLRTFDPGFEPESWLLDTLLALSVLVVIVAYRLGSRILAIMLGAFPPPLRPLPPMRRLEPTDTKITPAVVRVAVPPLPRPVTAPQRAEKMRRKPVGA
jgi:hypothetical protein